MNIFSKWSSSTLVFASAASALWAAETSRPNVIFILADDLGYRDLSCTGQAHFKTPNIDRLARQGMTFTRHYSGSSVCAPSRCSLLTGLHTGHAAVRGNAEHPPEGQVPMPADTFTAADLMKAAGYTTGVFGKWGLGYPGSASDPLKMGFDHFYGYNCQRLAHSYYPAWLWNNDQREFLWGNVGSFHRDYAPDFIHRAALDFIRENKDRPFFCYYAAVQPHADMVAPEKYMEKFRGKFLPESSYPEGYYMGQPEAHAAFAAMVHVLDDYVGEIMAELKGLGIAENTVVIFSSDNGPHQEGGHDPDYFDSNGVFRGFKRDLYDGGIHVPLIVSWPGRIPSETISDLLSAFWDFLPTMAELTGQSLTSPTDGISMLPTWLGREGQRQHEYLYWEFHEQGGRVAVLKDHWKGVRYGVDEQPDSPLELYDLSNDPGETQNIAAQYPEIVKELNQLIQSSRTESSNPQFNFR
ncbi:MAG: arylsulfatase [Kiritimatiellales bacterium]